MNTQTILDECKEQSGIPQDYDMPMITIADLEQILTAHKVDDYVIVLNILQGLYNSWQKEFETDMNFGEWLVYGYELQSLPDAPEEK